MTTEPRVLLPRNRIRNQGGDGISTWLLEVPTFLICGEVQSPIKIVCNSLSLHSVRDEEADSFL